MNATVFSHEHIIGSVYLKAGDTSMGHVYGTLTPTDFYYSQIRKDVWDFFEAKSPDFDIWSSLRINVQLENGYFLFPVGGYTIDDSKDFPNESIRLNIAGLNLEFSEGVFPSSENKDLTIEPWVSISIKQKIAFENELSKELGLSTNSKPLFQLFRSPKQKSFITSVYSALCKNIQNDEVLFEINRSDTDKKFAVIHLTWSQKQEFNGYPNTTLYKTYENFRTQRMIVDSKEWF